MVTPIRNETRQTVVAEQALVARWPWQRLRGMIGRRFTRIDGMIFPHCSAIHTWFMSQAIDVLFLNADGQVVGQRVALPPWRLARQGGARTTIELPAGSLADNSTRPGDRVTWAGQRITGQ